ncbi:MAG: DUF1573 domain-containing protein [Bacteroidales bacterium]|jgi:Mg-chelatase subunit ChlD|nr:DUF1573 domain-containing protein [Bacteroidales bacterium]
MKKLLVFLLLFTTGSIFAQKPVIEIDKLTHDFGNYTPIYYPPATFSFTNTGTAPLAILTVQAAYEVKVMYEQGYIFPGETRIVTIDYQSQESGPFQERIQIYTNADTVPFHLEIKGINISANECYPDKKNREMRKVITIDAQTKKPIPETEVFFYFQQQQKIQEVTEKNGEVVMTLPIGIYDIQAQHPQYRTLQKNMFIPKTKPIIVLELEPRDELEEMLDTVKIEKIAIHIPPQNPRTQQPSYPFANSPGPNRVNTANPGELSTIEYKPNNIVFLIDISYSMKQNERLTKLKSSLNQTITVLRDIDTISLIAYNHDAYILIEKTTGAHKENLRSSIDTLTPIGLTDGVRGLERAYNLSQSGYIFDGNNQIILATDGEFSGSQQSEPEIMKLIKENSNHGIFISIISFGDDKEALSRLRKIARIGKGSYIHIENTNDTPEIILEEIKGRSKIMM